MKKLILIAVMAVFSSGVFAAGERNKEIITNKSEEKFEVNLESKIYNSPKEKLGWPCFVCTFPGGTMTYKTPCGKTTTIEYASMTLIDLVMMIGIANDIACGTSSFPQE